MSDEIVDLRDDIARTIAERDEARAICGHMQISLEAVRRERDEIATKRDEYGANAAGLAGVLAQEEELRVAAQRDCDALRTRLDYAESSRDDMRRGLALCAEARDRYAAEASRLLVALDAIEASIKRAKGE